MDSDTIHYIPYFSSVCPFSGSNSRGNATRAHNLKKNIFLSLHPNCCPCTPLLRRGWSSMSHKSRSTKMCSIKLSQSQKFAPFNLGIFVISTGEAIFGSSRLTFSACCFGCFPYISSSDTCTSRSWPQCWGPSFFLYTLFPHSV